MMIIDLQSVSFHFKLVTINPLKMFDSVFRPVALCLVKVGKKVHTLKYRDIYCCSMIYRYRTENGFSGYGGGK